MFDFLPKDIQKIGTALVKGFVLLGVGIYVVSPIDLLPGLPFDDIVVAVMGLSFVGIDVTSLFSTSRDARASYQAKGKKVK